MNEPRTIFASNNVRVLGFKDGSIRVELWHVLGSDSHPVAATKLNDDQANELVVALRGRSMLVYGKGDRE